MKIGIILRATSDPEASLEKFITTARDIEVRGFSSFWLAHIRSDGALIAMELAARETLSLEVGSAVTPIQPRHPSSSGSTSVANPSNGPRSIYLRVSSHTDWL